MIVTPRFKGALCGTPHPGGCRRQVALWAERAQRRQRADAPGRMLVVGSSSGLGLGARIAATFGAGSASIGLALERPGEVNRMGTAGWYRCVAFEDLARNRQVQSRTVIGDAFDDGVKRRVADLVAADLGQVDLLLYSVATRTRRNPRTGMVHRSVFKTVGVPFAQRGYDIGSGRLTTVTMSPATADEIADTVAVMGGEDFAWWIDLLRQRQLLAPRARCVALSYVGVPGLAASYRGGTLGAAKDDLERTAVSLDAAMTGPRPVSVQVAVMRALITASSVAMPMSALYTILLTKVLAEQGLAEDVLDQGTRLLEGLADGSLPVDGQSRLRLDGAEQRESVQVEVWRRWREVSDETLPSLGAVNDFRKELHALYGFGLPGVDYTADVDAVTHSARVVQI